MLVKTKLFVKGLMVKLSTEGTKLLGQWMIEILFLSKQKGTKEID